MKALLFVIPVCIVLFVCYRRKDAKGYLLLIGIVTLPFGTDYSIMPGVLDKGWGSGIMVTLSNIAFLLLFVHLILQGKPFRVPFNTVFPIICFIGSCLLSMLNSTWLRMTLFQIVLITQAAFLYYLVVFNAIESEDDFRLVVYFLMISLLFQGIVANIQYFLGYSCDFFRTGSSVPIDVLSYGKMNVRRAGGTLLRPNEFAALVVPLLLLSFAIMCGTRIRSRLTLPTVILGASGLLFSFSRGGWVAFAVSFLFLQFVMIKRRMASSRMFFLTVVVVLLAICFHAGVRSRIYGDDQNAFQSRFPLNEIALNMVRAHPIIGVGGNTFWNVIRSYTITIDPEDTYLDVVHNQYLLVLAECGLLGLISFLLLLFSCFRESWRCARNTADPFLQASGIGITAAFLAFVVHGMVEGIVGSPLYLSQMFLLFALCSAANRFVPIPFEFWDQ
jgi:putative inorganic carbon (hco3(-)) transporter